MSLEPTLKHLSQRELSERWTIAETTLERWRSMGIGPVYVKLPGRVVYRITDVDAYPCTIFLGLKAGETVELEGQRYQVREIRAVGDGAELRTKLTRL